MVANDEVHAFLVGILDALHRLDAAVQSDHQLEVVLSGIVDAFERDAVSFVVTVRDVEFDLLLLEELFLIFTSSKLGDGDKVDFK